MNKNPSLLNFFGKSYLERMEIALRDTRNGVPVLLVDDDDRENEGDIIIAAEKLTVETMAQMIRECSGIVCLCLPQERMGQLELEQMVPDNSSQYGTAFTITIEAREGVTTGVSASDRVQTIKTAIADDCKPSDLNRPGHVFPLRAVENGVMARRGHTEGSVDLARLAGLKSAGVLCELTNPDGSMSKLPEIVDFAKKHNYVVISIQDIVDYRNHFKK